MDLLIICGSGWWFIFSQFLISVDIIMCAANFDVALGRLCPAVGAYFKLRDGFAGMIFSRDCWAGIARLLDPRRRYNMDVLVRRYNATIGDIWNRKTNWTDRFGFAPRRLPIVKHIGKLIYVQHGSTLYTYSVDKDDRPVSNDRCGPLGSTGYYSCRCVGGSSDEHTSECTVFSHNVYSIPSMHHYQVLPCGLEICWESGDCRSWYITNNIEFCQIGDINPNCLYSDFGDCEPIDEAVMGVNAVTRNLNGYSTRS